MRWMLKFGLLSAVLVALSLASIWALQRFNPFSIDGHLGIAMFLAVLLTAVVGIALMTLMFYSHNAGYDDAAHDAGKRERE